MIKLEGLTILEKKEKSIFDRIKNKLAKIKLPFVTTQKKYRLAYYLIAVLFTVFMLFSFRSAVVKLPQLVRGESYIAFDELIPIFDLKTQFVDQVVKGFSQLTSTNEIRVRYSVISTWIRFYPILLVGLVGLNTLSFILFVYITKRFIGLFYKDSQIQPSVKIIIATLITLPMFMLLLYGKITHFYTLIFGLALFSFSLLITIELALADKLNPKKYILLIILTLINPAVHYHIFFIVLAVIIFLISTIYKFLKERSFKSVYKYIIAWILLIFINLFVYSFLIYIGNNSYSLKNLNDVAPVTYSSLAGASPSLKNILSFDIYSPIDNYIYQNYLPPTSNILNVFYILLGLVPLILLAVARIRKIKIKLRNQYVYYLMLTIAFGSIYFAIGLNSKYSVYSIISDHLTGRFFTSTVGNLVLEVAHLLVQIIRFPHRFELIYMQTVILLAALGLASLYYLFSKVNIKTKAIRYYFYIIISLVIIIIPFLNGTLFSTIISSGNWDGAFQPISISGGNDIHNIIGTDKVFYAPYLELNKYIVDNQNIKHRFIDKFWIYYFNNPSSYYGLGGASVNKFDGFEFYRATLYESNWWIKILKDQGYKYLLNIKNTQSNNFDVKNLIDKEISTNTNLRKVFENNSFVLYRIDSSTAKSTDLIVTDWNNYIKLMNENSKLNADRFDYLPDIVDRGGNLAGENVLTDDPDNVHLYYEAIENPQSAFNIPISDLTFNQNLFSAANYQNNVLSFFNLLSTKSQFNKVGMQFPSVLLKGNGSYVGYNLSQKIKFEFNVTAKCSLYLNSINSQNNLAISLYHNNSLINTQGLSLTGNINNSSVKYTKLAFSNLNPGKYQIEINKQDNNPFVLNYFLCSNDNYQANLKLNLINKLMLSNGQILELFKKS